MNTRITWSRNLIQKKLVAYVDRLGRMPSCNELKEAGDNALSCAIPRWGGYRKWARDLNVELKGTETHWAMLIEDLVELMLEGKGFSVVRQTTRAPFDLLVNGHQVDVKAAHPSLYGKNKSLHQGWIFRTAKSDPSCDFYVCLCFDNNEKIIKTYVIPSSDALVTTITIAKKGRFEKYKNRFDQLS